MKRVKYSIALVLFIIGFVFIGESYIYYLDNFDSEFSSTTMYKPDYITDDEMKQQLIATAKKYNIDFFIKKEEINSTVDKNITIYGTTEANHYLQENLKLKEKKYPSLFSGEITIHYEDFKNIENISDITDYHFIGDFSKVKKFKVELIDIYSGNHPKPGIGVNESLRNVVFIWGIILTIILLFTYYDVLYQRKEALIKVSFGESLGKIISKNIICDGLILSILYVLASHFVSHFNHAFFHAKYSIVLFIIFLALNSCLYFFLYLYDIKETFSNSKHSNSLLVINYGLKVITIILSIIVVSGNIGLIFEGINYKQQKNFFHEFQDFSYYQFDYKLTSNNQKNAELINKSNIVQLEFYKQYFYKSFQSIYLTGNLNLTVPTILFNKNSLPYLTDKIPELRSKHFNDKIYYIIPEKYKDDSSTIANVQEVFNFFDDYKYETNYEILTYDSNVDMVAISEIFFPNRSKLIKNPIIVLNYTGAEDIIIDTETSQRKRLLAHDIMYLINETDYQSFLERHGLTNQIHVKTNVYDLYNHHWKIIKRSMIISIVLVLIILMLELIIINLILRLEYELNATELSIKKILGYTIWEKNKKIILITLLATIISIITSLVINVYFNISEARYLVYGGMVMLLVDIMFILINIRRIEKVNIQKILKGGSL